MSRFHVEEKSEQMARVKSAAYTHTHPCVPTGSSSTKLLDLLGDLYEAYYGSWTPHALVRGALHFVLQESRSSSSQEAETRILTVSALVLRVYAVAEDADDADDARGTRALLSSTTIPGRALADDGFDNGEANATHGFVDGRSSSSAQNDGREIGDEARVAVHAFSSGGDDEDARNASRSMSEEESKVLVVPVQASDRGLESDRDGDNSATDEENEEGSIANEADESTLESRAAQTKYSLYRGNSTTSAARPTPTLPTGAASTTTTAKNSSSAKALSADSDSASMAADKNRSKGYTFGGSRYTNDRLTPVIKKEDVPATLDPGTLKPSAAEPTPAPTTKTPETPAPTTKTPETPAPTTKTPETPAPTIKTPVVPTSSPPAGTAATSTVPPQAFVVVAPPPVGTSTPQPQSTSSPAPDLPKETPKPSTPTPQSIPQPPTVASTPAPPSAPIASVTDARAPQPSSAPPSAPPSGKPSVAYPPATTPPSTITPPPAAAKLDGQPPPPTPTRTPAPVSSPIPTEPPVPTQIPAPAPPANQTFAVEGGVAAPEVTKAPTSSHPTGSRPHASADVGAPSPSRQSRPAEQTADGFGQPGVVHPAASVESISPSGSATSSGSAAAGGSQRRPEGQAQRQPRGSSSVDAQQTLAPQQKAQGHPQRVDPLDPASANAQGRKPSSQTPVVPSATSSSSGLSQDDSSTDESEAPETNVRRPVGATKPRPPKDPESDDSPGTVRVPTQPVEVSSSPSMSVAGSRPKLSQAPQPAYAQPQPTQAAHQSNLSSSPPPNQQQKEQSVRPESTSDFTGSQSQAPSAIAGVGPPSTSSQAYSKRIR